MLDMRLAAIQRDLVNSKRDTKKRPEPYELHDFCGYLEKPKPFVDAGDPVKNAKLIESQINACIKGQS